MLFAALSGSSPATVAAVGSIAIAGMVRSGYPQAFAAGIVTNAGTLGILIPPSVVMVVYAAATETSVGTLFMAGVVPGILLGVVLMVAIYIIAVKKNLPALQASTLFAWLSLRLVATLPAIVFRCALCVTLEHADKGTWTAIAQIKGNCFN